MPAFKIYINPSKLINLDIIWSRFEKRILENIDWIFNGGYCIFDLVDNMCAIYISKDGIIWIPDEYRDEFDVDYRFNKYSWYRFKIDNNIIDIEVKPKFY